MTGNKNTITTVEELLALDVGQSVTDRVGLVWVRREEHFNHPAFGDYEISVMALETDEDDYVYLYPRDGVWVDILRDFLAYGPFELEANQND